MSAAYGKPEQYAIIEKVRQIFRKRGGGICTFRSLSRAFRIMDTNRDKRLNDQDKIFKRSYDITIDNVTHVMWEEVC